MYDSALSSEHSSLLMLCLMCSVIEVLYPIRTFCCTGSGTIITLDYLKSVGIQLIGYVYIWIVYLFGTYFLLSPSSLRCTSNRTISTLIIMTCNDQ